MCIDGYFLNFSFKYYTGSLFLIFNTKVSRARAALCVVLCTVYSILASVLQGTSLEVSLPPYLPSSDGPPAPLPPSVAPSLLRSLPPSLLPLAPSMHSSVHSSLVPFLNHPTLPILPLPHSLASLLPRSIPLLPPSTTLPLFPPSHPRSFVAPSVPARGIQFNVHCVCGWQAVLSRPLLFSAKRHVALRQWGSHSCRRRSFNDPLFHSAYVLPPRIRFRRMVKNPTIETCNNTLKHGPRSYLSEGPRGYRRRFSEPSRTGAFAEQR